MVEKEEIINDDNKIAEELNNFLKNAVASLNIQENQLILTNVEQDSDPIDRAIKKISISPKHFTYQKQNWRNRFCRFSLF